MKGILSARLTSFRFGTSLDHAGREYPAFTNHKNNTISFLEKAAVNVVRPPYECTLQENRSSAFDPFRFSIPSLLVGIFILTITHSQFPSNVDEIESLVYSSVS